MGKWTDKLYITHGEWKSGEFRGSLSKEKRLEKSAEREYKRLPFDHCALSLQPFSIPVCTKGGIVFDFEQVERYIRLNEDSDGSCKCPITGGLLKLQDLCRLDFAKNAAGEYTCPVTGRVFAENTKVFANLKNGNVYSAEAVEQMCESGVDFVTERPCKRADFVCIIDPETAGFSRNCATRHIALKEDTSTSQTRERMPVDEPPRPSLHDVSNGKMAAALTSTSLMPILKREIGDGKVSTSTDRLSIPRPIKNATIVLRTTHGDCQAVLFAPMMPITVYNFVTRAKQGDYCNSPIFSISDDALITGLCPADCKVPIGLREQPHKHILHSDPGCIGMCTDGGGTTSQFYITFRPTPQFNGTNRAFGKLELKNHETRMALEKLCNIPVNSEGAPLEYAGILDVIVMFDPFGKDEERVLKHCEQKKKSTCSAIDSANRVGKYLRLT